MKSTHISLVVFCIGLAYILSPAQDFRQAYIDQYKDIAIQEMERAGVPASIKLAQAILESDYGRSDLARRANNHFGIKCGANWTGREYYKEDDDYDANGRLIKSCFRVYRSAEASFIAHSEFLRDPAKEDRYGFLFRLDPTDYKSWARGLKRAGYATAANYGERLIGIIESFQLYQYDRLGQTPIVDVTVPDRPANNTASGYNNDVRFVLSADNETVSTIARRTDVSLSQLIKYNEQLTDGEQRLAEGTVVYLQPKRNSYRGRADHHFVKEGETMFDISQLYGVKLSKLLQRNRMSKGMEPATGQRIKLRGGRVKQRPALQGETPMLPNNNGSPIPDVLPTPAPTTPPDNTTPIPTPAPPATPSPAREPVIRPGNPPATTAPNTSPAAPPSNNPSAPAPPTEASPEPPAPPTLDAPVRPQEPPSQPNPTASSSATPPPAPAGQPVFHVVERGDTLWNISQRYGTTVAELRRLNNLRNDQIQLGQRLRVK